MMFIDTVHLLIQAGDGGKGCESYYHRMDRKAVSDGGDGGDGGSVVVRADRNAPPLSSFTFKQHLIAPAGGHGGSVNKRGRNGENLTLLVPPGTKIFDREKNLLIRQLDKIGDEVVVLRGGRGGSGNHAGRPATFGEKGKSMDVEFRIKLAADIFLVGLPNAGKSALLNKLTNAKLKEEAYPFTTMSPEIAVYSKSDYESLTLCELPSLYASSHEGRGRGNEFLRHLEGAKFVFYVLSPDTGFADSLEEGWKLLRDQVGLFDEKLLDLPYGVIINKKDLLSGGERSAFSVGHRKVPKIVVSALTGEGLDDLRNFMDEKIDSWTIDSEEGQK